MEFTKVGALQIVLFLVGLLIWVGGPVAMALIWKFKKKERLTTVLVGAGTFIIFALILEKPIQNVLLFPTQMGLQSHGLSQFVNAHPLLLSFLVGLFPGVFEETGRFVAFKTILKNRKNKETSISHGIGHGGIEVILTMALVYLNNIIYSVLINSGAYASVVEQTQALAPDQVPQLLALPDQLAAFSFGDFAIGIAERSFAVLFHIGASILVFYACRDKKRSYLFPLAVLLHTIMDFVAGLYMTGLLKVTPVVLELIIFVFGLTTFLGAYFLIYKKDKADE
ncbi:MAG: YhfC family intramembrane metalloprotease [Lachnospiraceae bacterium]|nr:YhfC family intramembrane metalloprotease [Lachnospiraceae bacterium]